MTEKSEAAFLGVDRERSTASSRSRTERNVDSVIGELEEAMHALLDQPVKGDFMSLTRAWRAILEGVMVTDCGMMITALAFLAMHHQRERDENLRDAARLGARSNCRRIAAHHLEQLHQIGEQTALLGGRNAYPRS